MNEIFFDRSKRDGVFKRLLWRAAGSCALGGLYPGRFGEHFLRIEEYDMPLPGLGKGLDGARLAHISDLHCSPLVLNRYLRQCVKAVNELDIDFVAVTGDFINGSKFFARRIANILSGLNPRIATVACLGNHDYGIYHPRGLGGKSGLADYVTHQLGHADIFVMLNETRVFRRDGSAIQFIGLEDYWSDHYNPQLAFEDAHNLPTIVLCHNPDPAKELAELGADWILSGHTHGTNAKLPLYNIVMPIHDNDYFAGRYSLAQGKNLYVTRGLGYARRVNVNTRPEITVFTFRDVPKAGQA